MLTLKEQAEVCRIGLVIGLLSPKDVTRWADQIISMSEQPDYEIIEVSLMSISLLPYIVEKLYNVKGNGDHSQILNTVLGLCYYALEGGMSFDILNKLIHQYRCGCNIRSEFDFSVPEDIWQEISLLSDALTLASNLVYGNANDVYSATLDFLRPYARYADGITFERA